MCHAELAPPGQSWHHPAAFKDPHLVWLCRTPLTPQPFAFCRYRGRELEIHHEADPGLGCSLQAGLWQSWPRWLGGQEQCCSPWQPAAALGGRRGAGRGGRAGRGPAGCPALRPGRAQAQAEVRAPPWLCAEQIKSWALHVQWESRKRHLVVVFSP